MSEQTPGSGPFEEHASAAADVADPTPDRSDPGRIAIGIDIGGSGIKASAVDVAAGTLVGERFRVATPDPSTPEACIRSVARLVKRIVKAFPDAADAPVGIGVPAVVVGGVTRTAANIDPGWTGFPADEAFEQALKRPVHMVNDADAAGVAEMRFGAGIGRPGTVLVLTLGTGVGSALFIDGRLVPNTELGHMEIRGKDAEWRSAANARVRRGLSWKAWAADLDEHLNAIDRILTPSLIVLGGGVSKRTERFLGRLTVPVEVIPAALRNDAGMVGAAMFAIELAGWGPASAAGGDEAEVIELPAGGDVAPTAEAAVPDAEAREVALEPAPEAAVVALAAPVATAEPEAPDAVPGSDAAAPAAAGYPFDAPPPEPAPGPVEGPPGETWGDIPGAHG